jgi:hypothetical protein
MINLEEEEESISNVPSKEGQEFEDGEFSEERKE